MLVYLTVINTFLLVVIICQRGIKLSILRSIERRMATQEEQLQEALGLIRNTIAPGVTEIIRRLGEVTVPTDNPALQDEIDGVKEAAGNMASQINAVLNPDPEPTPS